MVQLHIWPYLSAVASRFSQNDTQDSTTSTEICMKMIRTQSFWSFAYECKGRKLESGNFPYDVGDERKPTTLSIPASLQRENNFFLHKLDKRIFLTNNFHRVFFSHCDGFVRWWYINQIKLRHPQVFADDNSTVGVPAVENIACRVSDCKMEN